MDMLDNESFSCEGCLAEDVAQNDRQVTQEAQAELQAVHGWEVVPLEQAGQLCAEALRDQGHGTGWAASRNPETSKDAGWAANGSGGGTTEITRVETVGGEQEAKKEGVTQ
ncbi:hypothetical protein JZ751_013777 [Albula glossodonta]|uniref:Uncharacterized protein n=1 Tax=Albula glossodonta TaxID=121402 RepID=A0A8T2P4M6_9TELE|nr:hypothetical protein JZ751_013777 [Albula glossodonta]